MARSSLYAVIDFAEGRAETPRGADSSCARRRGPVLEFPDGNGWARLSSARPSVMARSERDPAAVEMGRCDDKRWGFAEGDETLSEDSVRRTVGDGS